MAIFSGIAAIVAGFAGAIGASIAAVGTFIGGLGAIGSFALKVAASIGLNLLARALAGRPKQPSFSMETDVRIGEDIARSFPLGHCITAGSLVWINTWGQDGKTPNSVLTQVIAVSDLVGDGYDDVWIDDRKVIVDYDDPGDNDDYPVVEFRDGGRDHLWIGECLGDQTAPHPVLTSASTPGNVWPAAGIGYGIAYLTVSARVNEKFFTGIPRVRVTKPGIPLYDISRDSTAGGDGPQRWGEPETWGGDGDDLPAVQIYNILRGITYNGVWLYGLQDVPAARLPAADWIAAIETCREEVETPDGDEPRYRSGGMVSVDKPPADLIEDLLSACSGRLIEVGGTYYLQVGAPPAAADTFEDGDIISTEGQSFAPYLGLARTVTGITATWPNPAEAYAMKDAPAIYRADLEATAGNRRLAASVSFPNVPYKFQVQRLMSEALNEAERARRHTLVLPPRYWVRRPGETLAWTSAENGYEAKLFRIDGMVDRDNGDVMLDLTEVDPGDFYPPDYVDQRDGPTGPIDVPVQAIEDWDAEPVVITGDGGLERAGIRLLWNGVNLDDVEGVAFEVRRPAETELVYDGVTPAIAVPRGKFAFSANLAPRTAYQVRGKFVTNSGRPTAWSAWINITTPNVRVSTSELEDRFLDAQARFDERIRDFEGRLDQIGGAIASIEAVTTEQDQMLVERARRISASLGGAKADITQTEVVIATLINAFAALGIDVTAALNTGSAAGFFRIIAEVTEDDELAALLFGASTTRDGVSADAAFRMIVALGQSIIQLKASRTEFLDDADDAFAVFDGATRTLYAERIASGTTRKHVRLVRSTGSGLQPLGVGNVVAGTANGWREVSIGSINVRENAAALSGAPAGAGLIEANFRLAARGNGTVSVGKVDNSQPVYLWLEFGIIARRTGYTDVLLNDPPVQLPLVLFQFASSGDWSADAPLAVDTSLVPLDAGTWDFYLGWRLRGQNNATIADTTRQATISGHVIVSADLC